MNLESILYNNFYKNILSIIIFIKINIFQLRSNLRHFPTFTSFQKPTNEKSTQCQLKLSNKPLFLLFAFK